MLTGNLDWDWQIYWDIIILKLICMIDRLTLEIGMDIYEEKLTVFWLTIFEHIYNYSTPQIRLLLIHKTNLKTTPQQCSNTCYWRPVVCVPSNFFNLKYLFFILLQAKTFLIKRFFFTLNRDVFVWTKSVFAVHINAQSGFFFHLMYSTFQPK